MQSLLGSHLNLHQLIAQKCSVYGGSCCNYGLNHAFGCFWQAFRQRKKIKRDILIKNEAKKKEKSLMISAYVTTKYFHMDRWTVVIVDLRTISLRWWVVQGYMFWSRMEKKTEKPARIFLPAAGWQTPFWIKLITPCTPWVHEIS